MATITHALSYISGHEDIDHSDRSYGYVARVIWETVGDDDTGTSVEISAFADKTITATGTFGAGTVTVQGSNDDSNWFTCTDHTGADVEFSAAGMALIAENPRYLRILSDSGSSNDVDVILHARLVL